MGMRVGSDGAIGLPQVPPGPGNRESFVVEQAFDLEHHVHVFLAIHAVSAGTLHRLQHGELGLPVAQDKRFQLRQSGDFPDAIQSFFGSGLRRDAHRRVSSTWWTYPVAKFLPTATLSS